jgi:acetylglutamate synthase
LVFVLPMPLSCFVVSILCLCLALVLLHLSFVLFQHQLPKFCKTNYNQDVLLSVSLPCMATPLRFARPFQRFAGRSCAFQSTLHRHNARAISSGSSSDTIASRELITQLFGMVTKTSEVRQYLKYYGSVKSEQFAIIRASGDIMNEERQVDDLTSALAFLHRVGLVPIVVLGAGLFTGRRSEAVSKALEGSDRGAQEETKRALQVGLEYMHNKNSDLVHRLQQCGVCAESMHDGVFEAVLENDPSSYWCGVGGRVRGVNVDAISAVVKKGCIPVVSSSGFAEAVAGSDVLTTFRTSEAVVSLVKAFQPLKVIWLRQEGGLRQLESGKTVSSVTIPSDLDHLLNSDSAVISSLDKKNLEEVAQLFNVMNPGNTIAITSPKYLGQELFQLHHGEGTLIWQGERIIEVDNLRNDVVDLHKIKILLEDAFGKELPSDYFETIESSLHRIYLCESYRGVAIFTRGHEGIPYLDKFGVLTSVQGDRLGEQLWQRIVKVEDKMYWRSRATNRVNSWYYDRADGGLKTDRWHVFWRNLNHDQAFSCIKDALSIPSTFR